MSENSFLSRRQLIFILSTGAVTFLYNACSGGFNSALENAQNLSLSPGSSGDGGANPSNTQGPVWQEIPTISFTQGVPGRISIAAYVSDPAGYALTITKNLAALPPGVTFDVATKSFIYDGIGNVSSTEGHILTATES